MKAERSLEMPVPWYPQKVVPVAGQAFLLCRVDSEAAGNVGNLQTTAAKWSLHGFCFFVREAKLARVRYFRASTKSSTCDTRNLFRSCVQLEKPIFGLSIDDEV